MCSVTDGRPTLPSLSIPCAPASTPGSKAMGPGGARPFYEAFLERLRAAYEPGKVKDGRFGAMMKVELINGAGTLCLPSFLWSS